LKGNAVVNAATLDGLLNKVKTVRDRLQKAEPGRKQLLASLRNMYERIQSSALDATKDRLAEIEKVLDDSAVRHVLSPIVPVTKMEEN